MMALGLPELMTVDDCLCYYDSTLKLYVGMGFKAGDFVTLFLVIIKQVFCYLVYQYTPYDLANGLSALRPIRD